MTAFRKPMVVAMVTALVLVATSCRYYDIATAAQKNGNPVPWWCNPTEEVPVTAGPASGTVDWYAGTHKAPLSWGQCLTLSSQFDQARDFALQWPTEASATAAGWNLSTGYVAGMGTHHIRGGVTAAMLADPNFDPSNPILDAAGLDDVFDPTRPEVLQYEGTGPTARLVGFDYYVRTSTGLPPEGFPGNNDWWHHHPKVCFRKSNAVMNGFNLSDTACTNSGGINVNMANYYMLHVWILDDMAFTPDVYAGMMPCIANGTAVHDQNNSCHTSRGAMSMAHDMTPGG